MKKKEITKRTISVIMVTLITAVTTLFVTGCQCPCSKGKVAQVKNEEFYKGGVFQADKAKDSYFAMMKSYNYPIPEILKTDNFWVCDFLQGKNDKIGMGGIFWINETGKYGKTGTNKYKGKFAGQPFGYLGHDIYVLPGQALPEHHHIGGAEGYGPKMEAWHVRHGEAYFFSELATPGGDEILISKMPVDERPWGYGEPWFKCKYVAKRKAGEMYKLNDPESWHFLRGGKNGAIISEYATYHNNVEFSKPGMEFASTGAKK
jgi:hypothetical protein